MRPLLLLPLFSLIALAGCSSTSVVGTWQVTGLEDKMEAGTADIKMTFGAGGDATMLVDAEVPLPGGQSVVKLATTMTGTYEVTDAGLDFVANDAEIKVEGLDNLPPAAEQLFEQQKEQIIADNNKRPPMKMEWQSPNRFIAKAEDGTTATFTRIE